MGKVYTEGTAVRFWMDADAEPLSGTVISVGRGNGTYRIRSGRRVYTVSFGMAKAMKPENGAASKLLDALREMEHICDLTATLEILANEAESEALHRDAALVRELAAAIRTALSPSTNGRDPR